jgi:SAM-dependent methyltransferase
MLDAVKLATPEDVVMCYRLFLKREPENNEVIERHLESKPTTWQLVQRFVEAQEHNNVLVDQGSLAIWHRQDGRNICIDASGDANNLILKRVEETWSAYGKQNPYYSVITDPAYAANDITTERKQIFYQSGHTAVDMLKLAFERNRIELDVRWHILELGCGVGRIGEHFCQNFQYYYGVDISASHLAYAQTRFLENGINNARLMLLKDALENDISFDIFYSMIVLQHNPPPVMYHLLDQFLMRLKPRGYAFFQLPCHLYGYSFDTARYLAERGAHNMEMHALPQQYVFDVLHKHRLRPIELWPFPVIGPIGISYVFFARKDEDIEHT